MGSLERGSALEQLLDALPPDTSVLQALAGGGSALDELVAQLEPSELATLLMDPRFSLRPEQRADPRSRMTALIGGRGGGKSYAGATFALGQLMAGVSPGGLVGPTYADVRDTMLEGPSGLLKIAPPWFTVEYEPSKKKVTAPNGAYALCYTADKPARLRGPNMKWVWADELAAWDHELAAWDQLEFVLRIGTPRIFVTTTPRPLKKLLTILFGEDEADQRAQRALKDVVIRRSTSFANAANLAAETVARWRVHARSDHGRQEILGEFLFDVGGAIFSKALARMARTRIDGIDNPAAWAAVECERRIIAVDPAQSSSAKTDETAIIAEGKRVRNGLTQVLVLADRSLHGSPNEWGSAAVRAALEFQADTIVAEANTGGEMVTSTIQAAADAMGVRVNIQLVRAAEKKSKRAEPVAALGETDRLILVNHLPRLEGQLERFNGVNGRRDDRADAMCWGAHHLAIGPQFWMY